MANGDNTAIDSLDTLESEMGFDRSWFDSLETTVVETTGKDIIGSEGEKIGSTRDTQFGNDKESIISSDIIDNLIPAIGIGAGELVSKLVGRRPEFPVGWHQKTRALGKVGVAYMIAADAYSLTRDFALSQNVKPTVAMGTGAATAYGAFKGSKAAGRLALNVASNMKAGMTSYGMEVIMKNAWDQTYKEILEAGMGRGGGKAAAKLMADEAAEAVSRATFDVLKARLGTEGAKHLDDVTRQLKNPKIAMRVGKFLAKRAPGLAIKLGASVTAFSIPEPVSTVTGAAMFLWTVNDVFNLIQSMPGLYEMIFEEPKPDKGAYFTTQKDSEGTIEDQIIRDLVDMEQVFPLDQHPVNTSRKQ